MVLRSVRRHLCCPEESKREEDDDDEMEEEVSNLADSPSVAVAGSILLLPNHSRYW
jgi:hypothetical protein